VPRVRAGSLCAGHARDVRAAVAAALRPREGLLVGLARADFVPVHEPELISVDKSVVAQRLAERIAFGQPDRGAHQRHARAIFEPIDESHGPNDTAERVAVDVPVFGPQRKSKCVAFAIAQRKPLGKPERIADNTEAKREPFDEPFDEPVHDNEGPDCGYGHNACAHGEPFGIPKQLAQRKPVRNSDVVSDAESLCLPNSSALVFAKWQPKREPERESKQFSVDVA